MESTMITCRVLPAILALASWLPAQIRIVQPPLEPAERTRWFRESKFGIFVHWGPYAVIGRHEWARNRFQIPQDQYDVYARQFNPVHFNAQSWVDLAAGAGARYMVITSKHHDGFSIYRSKVSNYDMEITPYAGDPLKDLSAAAERAGLRLGIYHSIMDWHHPDYRPRRSWESKTPNEGGNLDRYIDFMKEQLRELLTGYGNVAVVWFDGEWEHTTAEMRSDEVFDFIRSLSPNTLINDRLYKREPGNRADFGTPEQFVPATGVLDPSGKPVLWEACVTINNDSWGYNKYETEFKTTRDLIRMLVEVVSKGGNLLLNVGPMPDGRIQDEFVTRLRAMGEWMRVNGEAIYETTASPFARLPFFGRVTTKGNKLYLHVFDWPANGLLRVPGLKNLIHSARLLADPDARVNASRDGDDIVIHLPAQAPDAVASVVELVLDGVPDPVQWSLRPGEKGAVELDAASCEIESKLGQRAKKENALGHVFLTRWSRSDDVPVWEFSLPKAGLYQVDLSYAAGRNSAGTEFAVESGASTIPGKVEDTGGDWVFRSFTLPGTLALSQGTQSLRIRAAIKGDTPAMQLERVVLRPAGK